MKVNYSFYLILDENSCKEQSVFDVLTQVIDCGISCIQLRIKNTSSQHIKTTGEKILEITRSKNIPFIINDYVQIVKQIDADGVHIGPHDMPYREARRWLGNSKIIGVSIENEAQAELYRESDVDYFGVGPVFSTSTKLDAAKTLGPEKLKRIVKILTKPVVAIGGINEKNIPQVFATGVSGVAVVSAVLKAPHPTHAAKKIAEIISQCH